MIFWHTAHFFSIQSLNFKPANHAIETTIIISSSQRSCWRYKVCRNMLLPIYRSAHLIIIGIAPTQSWLIPCVQRLYGREKISGHIHTGSRVGPSPPGKFLLETGWQSVSGKRTFLVYTVWAFFAGNFWSFWDQIQVLMFRTAGVARCHP